MTPTNIRRPEKQSPVMFLAYLSALAFLLLLLLLLACYWRYTFRLHALMPFGRRRDSECLVRTRIYDGGGVDLDDEDDDDDDDEESESGEEGDVLEARHKFAPGTTDIVSAV